MPAVLVARKQIRTQAGPCKTAFSLPENKDVENKSTIHSRLEKEEGIRFEYKEDDLGKSNNVMDRWILSFTQSLVQFVKQEMDGE